MLSQTALQPTYITNPAELQYQWYELTVKNHGLLEKKV